LPDSFDELMLNVARTRAKRISEAIERDVQVLSLSTSSISQDDKVAPAKADDLLRTGSFVIKTETRYDSRRYEHLIFVACQGGAIVKQQVRIEDIPLSDQECKGFRSMKQAVKDFTNAAIEPLVSYVFVRAFEILLVRNSLKAKS